jgi:hypothetical protein
MRKLFLALVMVALGLPALVFQAPVVAAAPLADLICPFSITGTASPGLTLTSQLQHITGQVKIGSGLLGATPCSSLSGVPYHGATGAISASGTESCLLQGSLSGTSVLTWDNGDTSTITATERVVFFIPILTATITSGALAGASIVVVAVPTGFAGTCVLGPVRSVTLTGIAVVARL